MTLVPMRKRCSKCGRYYEWNPDVGIGLSCTYCRTKGLADKIKEVLFDGSKKKSK